MDRIILNTIRYLIDMPNLSVQAFCFSRPNPIPLPSPFLPPYPMSETAGWVMCGDCGGHNELVAKSAKQSVQVILTYGLSQPHSLSH